MYDLAYKMSNKFSSNTIKVQQVKFPLIQAKTKYIYIGIYINLYNLYLSINFSKYCLIWYAVDNLTLLN